MDIVYIIGGKTDCDWWDLRCSLRSLKMFGKGVDRVIVAGETPSWLSDDVEKWKFEQPYPSPSGFKEKHRNLQETLRFIASHEDCPDEFIVGFSDVFLTQTVDFDSYPFYAKLTSSNGIDLPKSPSTDYNKSLVSTRCFLQEHDLPTRYTTMHRFIRMKKSDVLGCGELFDEINEKDLSVEPFVLVGNWGIKNSGIKTIPVKDYKISRGDEWWKSNPGITDCFSVRHLYYGPLLILLQSLYQNKCDYEG